MGALGSECLAVSTEVIDSGVSVDSNVLVVASWTCFEDGSRSDLSDSVAVCTGPSISCKMPVMDISLLFPEDP